jgi:hypothetical protein
LSDRPVAPGIFERGAFQGREPQSRTNLAWGGGPCHGLVYYLEIALRRNFLHTIVMLCSDWLPYDETSLAKRSVTENPSRSMKKMHGDAKLPAILSLCSVACLRTIDKDGEQALLTMSHSVKPGAVNKPAVLDPIKNRRDTTRHFDQNKCSWNKNKNIVADYHYDTTRNSCIRDKSENDNLHCHEPHVNIALSQSSSSQFSSSSSCGMDDDISSLVRDLELIYLHSAIASRSTSNLDPVRFLRDPLSSDPPKLYHRKKQEL